MYKKIKGTRLSHWKMTQLITEWCYATPAAICARKLNLSRTTVDLWYKRIRLSIIRLPPPLPFTGAVEVDESYFGIKPLGLKGTGTIGKVGIFGIRSRETGQVWATIVPGIISQKNIIPIIQKSISPKATIYSDGFGGYTPLKSLGYKHHVVYHAHTFTTSFGVHTNGIESFWRYLRHFFRSKRTIGRKLYPIYLQEAVFRFNTRPTSKLREVVRKNLRQI